MSQLLRSHAKMVRNGEENPYFRRESRQIDGERHKEEVSSCMPRVLLIVSIRNSTELSS